MNLNQVTLPVSQMERACQFYRTMAKSNPSARIMNTKIVSHYILNNEIRKEK